MATQRVGAYVEVAPGVDIYYEDEGEGPPLVLIPGWTFTTRVFDHQIAAFSDSLSGHLVRPAQPRPLDRDQRRQQLRHPGRRSRRAARSPRSRESGYCRLVCRLADRVAPCPQSGHGRHSRARLHRHAAARDELRPERLGRGGDRRSGRVLPGGTDRARAARCRHLVRRQRDDRGRDVAGG